MGIDHGSYSPQVLRQIVYAGIQNTSFAAGRDDLLNLARLKVSEKQVERVTQRIGQERVDQRHHQVQEFRALPVVEKFTAPMAHPPDLAVVSMDGGRLQIRDWPSGQATASGAATEPPHSATAAGVANPAGATEPPGPTQPAGSVPSVEPAVPGRGGWSLPRVEPFVPSRLARSVPRAQPAREARRADSPAVPKPTTQARPAESLPEAVPLIPAQSADSGAVEEPLTVEDLWALVIPAPAADAPGVPEPLVEAGLGRSVPGAEPSIPAGPGAAAVILEPGVPVRPAGPLPGAEPSVPVQLADSVPRAQPAREARRADSMTPLSQVRSGHWREDKIGLLMTMTSEPSTVDPCPTIPETFVNPLRILKLARELRKGCPPGADPVADPPEAEEENPVPGPEYTPPTVRVKSMVATRQPTESFGEMLATAAYARGFYGARRKAFLGDGAENNWTIQKRWFSDFVAILDFIHALSYVFAVAMAGRTFAAGWEVYVGWIKWVWQGRVAEVIAELERRQEEMGLPGADESETSPRCVVAEGLRYLKNHQDQMHYDEYRRLGLPITSSHVESTVKQFNRRVKGTEKFWSEAGAEAVLQLRADYLSDTEPMETFWKEREAGATGRRCYRCAV